MRSLSLCARRVRPSGWPHGLTGCRPPEVLPSRQPCRSDDVALLAVGVVQQRDARGAVGVVLDVRDLRRHAVLVVATEVDDAVGALVTAALVTDGDPAVDVAAALAVQRLDERLL